MLLFGNRDLHRELLKKNINKLGIPQDVFQEMMLKDTDGYFRNNYTPAPHEFTFYLRSDVGTGQPTPTHAARAGRPPENMSYYDEIMGSQMGRLGGGGVKNQENIKKENLKNPENIAEKLKVILEGNLANISIVCFHKI